MASPTDTRMTKERVAAVVRDLSSFMPEGTSLTLGVFTKKDGISYQSVKVLAASGNGDDRVVATGVREVVAAFRNAGVPSVSTRMPGGQEVRVLLDI